MKTYSYDEVRDASLDYFKGDELAADVFVGKYALQDLAGNIYEKTPSEMHRRMAKEFARIEAKYPNALTEDAVFKLFNDWTIVPQGSPMSALGNPYQLQSLSNCFVIESPYDSYGGILHTDQEEAQIMKRRGGVGIDVSTLRPIGLQVANAARTTDGLGVFMERYSNTCREVAQGGRRGALMQTISVHHPDVLTFINIKRDRSKVTGANVSVRVTDEFMNAVEKGEKYQQRFPVELKSGEKPQVERWIDAKSVWSDICCTMRDCSEPGILFWDTIIKNSPADIYKNFGFKTTSTNPCVVGSTLVETNAGVKTVKELADMNVKFFVKTYDEKLNAVIMSKATAFKTRDKAKVLRLKLKNGRSIRLTGDHLVYTDHGWKRADALTKEDKVLSIESV
jgi:ribonucleoside-diphosphate reductase alpha chain